MQTRFVLINTSHAGNVGAAARAMKTMGFDDLVLVAPRWPDVLGHEEAIRRASGGVCVLDRARVVATLDEALEGMTHVCATAMTPRDFGPPTVAPRDHFRWLVERHSSNETGLSPTHHTGIAFLFGSERYGMRNEDVYRCHVCLRIPTHPDFGSLNLAAALQIIAYDWREALGDHPSRVKTTTPPRLADAAEIAATLRHLEQGLVAIGFLDQRAPKKLMPRLNQLLNRANVTQNEIHILRGVAKAMLKTSH